jgi:hypothetical protein
MTAGSDQYSTAGGKLKGVNQDQVLRHDAIRIESWSQVRGVEH